MSDKQRQIFFSYDFRPVGQGLFSSGHLQLYPPLREQNQESPVFNWVYDCGTSSKQSFLNDQIDIYRDEITKKRINLLILSHFDQDHIGGVSRLLKNVKVACLVLPYLTPSERLAIVAMQNRFDAAFVSFLVNPAAYLRGLPGGAEANIVFILPGGDLPPEENAPDRDNPFSPTEAFFPGDWPDLPPAAERIREISIDQLDHEALEKKKFGSFSAQPPKTVTPPQTPSLKDDSPAEYERVKNTDPRVQFLDGSWQFRPFGLWEFCFYNIPRPDLTPKLWASVKPLYESFSLESEDDRDYASFVRELKKVYIKIFGDSSSARNNISLITYTGPVKRHLLETRQRVGPFSHRLRRRFLPYLLPYPKVLSAQPGKVSLLYTGDISLDFSRLEEIAEHYGADRWGQVDILQVPHHGASSSWNIKGPGSLSHSCSVFSFGFKNRYHHPHQSVLNAFSKNQPALVNQYQGFCCAGYACWKA